MDNFEQDYSVNRSKQIRNRAVSVSRSRTISRSRIDNASTIEILTAETFSKQFWFFMQMAVPSTVGYIIENLLEFINFLFLGFENDELLIGACGLGNCWIFIMVVSLPCGLGSAIDTLCSQAFGAKDYRALGVNFNRGVIIVNLALIPLLIVSWEVEWVFTFLGYDPVLASSIGEYVRYQFPSIILEVETLLMTRFLQSQRIYHVQFYVSLLTVSVHTVGCLVFVKILHLKLKGASIALDIASFVHFIVFYAYIKFSDRFTLSWVSFDYQSFTKWREFLSVAVPNAIMIIPEYFGLFVLGFEAGYLSKSELAAHAIMTTILNFVYGIAYGFTVCSGTLAGNSLGEFRPDLTSRVPFITFRCYYLCLVIVAILLYLFRSPIIHLFTEEPSTYGLCVSLFPLVLSTQLTDGLQAIFSGIIRGVGKTFTAAIGNVFAYIAILHPVAILLAFVAKLGVFGLWIGWFVGTGCSGVFYWLVWSKLDLEAIAKEIQEQNQSEMLEDMSQSFDIRKV